MNRPALGFDIRANLATANLVTWGLDARPTNSPYTSCKEFSKKPAVNTHRYLPQWPNNSMSPPVAMSVRSRSDRNASHCDASFLFRTTSHIAAKRSMAFRIRVLTECSSAVDWDIASMYSASSSNSR